MGIKGVIFDFNGTLFWDTEIHNEAWDVFLEKNGKSLTDREKGEKIHGKNNKDIISNLFPGQHTREEIVGLSNKKELIYQDLCLKTDMQLAPGAKDFLHFLMAQNIPYTIATASEIVNVNFYFEHLGLNSFFDQSKVVYDDGTMESKPNPRIFQRAIDVLGMKETEILIFEDSISGIMAAENAGAGRIIIVNSTGNDYKRWNYQIIRNFSEVDKDIFVK